MHSEVLDVRPKTTPRGLTLRLLPLMRGSLRVCASAVAPLPHCLTIDCSKSPEAALSSVLQWVRGYPERGGLHIILPSMRGQAAHRQALGSLMILGCRVTAKI